MCKRLGPPCVSKKVLCHVRRDSQWTLIEKGRAFGRDAATLRPRDCSKPWMSDRIEWLSAYLSVPRGDMSVTFSIVRRGFVENGQTD